MRNYLRKNSSIQFPSRSYFEHPVVPSSKTGTYTSSQSSIKTHSTTQPKPNSNMGSTSDLFSAGADVHQEDSVVSTWEISKTPKPPRYVRSLERNTGTTFSSCYSHKIITWSTNDVKSNRKSGIPPWFEYIHNGTKRNPKRPNIQPWLACTQVEAQPYEQYKKLYNERKFARDFVSVLPLSHSLFHLGEPGH